MTSTITRHVFSYPSLGHESAAADVLNLLGGADISRGAHAQSRASEPGAASNLHSPGPKPPATQPAATTGWREGAGARQGGEQEPESQEPGVYLRAMARCVFIVVCSSRSPSCVLCLFLPHTRQRLLRQAAFF